MKKVIAAALFVGLSLTGCSVKVNQNYKCVKTADGKTITEIVDRKKCKGKGK